MHVPTLPDEVWDQIASSYTSLDAQGQDTLAALSRTSWQLNRVTRGHLYQAPRLWFENDAYALRSTLDSNHNLGGRVRTLRVHWGRWGDREEFKGMALLVLMDAVRGVLEELTLEGVEIDLLADILSVPNQLKRVVLTSCVIHAPASLRERPPYNSVESLVIKKSRFSLRSLPSSMFQELNSFSFHNDEHEGMTNDEDMDIVLRLLSTLPPGKLMILRFLLYNTWEIMPGREAMSRVNWASALKRFSKLKTLECDWQTIDFDGDDPADPYDLWRPTGLVCLLPRRATVEEIIFHVDGNQWEKNFLEWVNLLGKTPNSHALASLHKVKVNFRVLRGAITSEEYEEKLRLLEAKAHFGDRKIALEFDRVATSSDAEILANQRWGL